MIIFFVSSFSDPWPFIFSQGWNKHVSVKDEEEEGETGIDQAVISISYADWVEFKNNLKIKQKSIDLNL